MILIDANLLLYAYDPSSPHHEAGRGWLEATFSRQGPVMDAHLAALAIEHGATLATTDKDFVRFPGLRLLNPLLPERNPER